MEIAEAIQVVKDAGDDASKITPEALAAISGYKPTSSEGLITEDEANARAARGRKKAESEASKLQTQLEDMSAQLEELQGGTGKADAAKQVERLAKQLDAAKAELTDAHKAHDATRRQSALNAISGEVGWHDGVDADTRSVLLERRLADLDTDDLSVADLVTPIIREFREKNAQLIDGSTKSGSGSAVNGHAPSTGPREVSKAALTELARKDPAEHVKTMAGVWAGVADESITLIA